MKIKVFLADDHQLLIAGFKAVLQEEQIEVVGTSNTLKQLRQNFLESKADVMVLDLRFNEDINGLDMAEELLKHDPKSKIIILSQFDDEWIVERAYRLGVLAFIRKDEINDLIHAISKAANGEAYYSSEIAKQLAKETIHPLNPRRLLSAQELSAFKHLADGMTAQEVATTMDVSYKTITIYQKVMKEKLGIETLPEFTKLAIKYGLVNTELIKRDK